MTSQPKTFIQLNSGDFSAKGGNASSFRNTLASPLKLSPEKDYEVCLYDAFFPIRQYLKSVYINCSLTNQSITGSQLTSSICFIPFTELTPALNQNLYYSTVYARKWYPISVKSANYIDISFTLSTGELIPINQSDYSTITIAVRERY